MDAQRSPDLNDELGEYLEPPPLYSDIFFEGEETPNVQDGRVEIDVDSKIGRILGRLIPDRLSDGPQDVKSSINAVGVSEWRIPLNIVIQVVGSRGDVQPFVALGCELRRYNHRVRLATHGTFEKFVRDAGLEFYDIGGNPEELMAYMVKNPGLIPGMKTLRSGEINRKRAMIAEMLAGCWRSCIEPDARSRTPFVAQAIIANPVSFAHVHCAQALRIPVHLMFTMPWTPTRAFPHPLANIKQSKQEPRLVNQISYGMVEWMTWQGIGDVVNKWRRSIDLEPIPLSEGPLLASTLKIPHTYCWSPALIPKPTDWPDHINVCGFFFRDMPSYEPPEDLKNFLASGPTPIYIGFGSIVIDDPSHLTTILIEAVKACGVRAIISRGWSKIGNATADKDIFYLDDCPHEWLFQRVSMVIHHGGAGTSACGLLNARPTVIVPFFGDQPFWGQMIAVAKAGPQPMPHKTLDSKSLADAITYCLTNEAATAAGQLAQRMRNENGIQRAAALFHQYLPTNNVACELFPEQPATWLYTRRNCTIRLSNTAVETLCRDSRLKVKRKDFSHYGPTPVVIQNRRWDPLTSGASAGIGMASHVTSSAVGMFADPAKVYVNHANAPRAEGRPAPHGQAATAFGKNFGNVAVRSVKGGLVDFPLALAEGFRNTPRLWGDDVKEQQEITGWSSGAVVAGKSLGYGLYDGVGGLFYKPYKGARDEGMLGFTKGFGRGVAGMVVGPATGVCGVLGYTGKGIAKSVDRAVHRKTNDAILAAKQAEGEYLLQTKGSIIPTNDVGNRFSQLLKP